MLTLSEKRHRYCLAVPVLDEGARIARQLEKMAPLADTVDLVIADGGSTDGSLEPDRLRAHRVRARLTKTGPGRLGAQIRMAFGWALDEGYDGVILVDGNDKDDLAGVIRFVEALDAGYGFVQGSRYIPGGVGENTPWSRHLGVRLIHAPLLSLAARFPYTDTTNGFRAFSRSFLEDPEVDVFRDVLAGYELHYYLALRAAELGYPICEVPVTRRYPTRGRTPTKISPLRGNLGVLAALLRTCAGHYHPGGHR